MKRRINTSPLGTSHFDVSATLVGLNPFNTPGALETGRIASFQPPDTLGTGGNQWISPQVPVGLEGLSRSSPPCMLGTGSSKMTGTGESLTESRVMVLTS